MAGPDSQRGIERNDDPEQTLAAHLLQELNPECGCAVCAVLREWFDEQFASTGEESQERE